MELELAVPAVFDRIPTLRLATEVGKLELASPGSNQGLKSLPVTW
jgi:hypothetical protein